MATADEYHDGHVVLPFYFKGGSRRWSGNIMDVLCTNSAVVINHGTEIGSAGFTLHGSTMVTP